MVGLAAAAATPRQAVAQGSASARIQVSAVVVPSALAPATLDSAVERATADTAAAGTRQLPAGALLAVTDRPVDRDPIERTAPAERPRVVRTISLTYTAN